MKKYLISFFAMVIGYICLFPTMTAQPSSQADLGQIRKTAEKDAKKEAKRLNKEKWSFNGSGSLETALTNYFIKTAAEQPCKASIQTINSARSVSRGESLARSAAETDFAREVKIAIAGRIAEHEGMDETVVISDIEKVMVDELKGEINKSFTLYKKNKDNTYEVRVYFVIPNLDSPQNSRTLNKKIEDEIELANKISKAATSDN